MVDSFFGIGIPELVMILIIAGIVMGPARIAQFARWLGKTTAYLQSISRGFTRQLQNELDTIDQTGELKATLSDMKDLQREVADLRRELNQGTRKVLGEGEAALQETESEMQNSIQPPDLTIPQLDTPPPTPSQPQNGNGRSPSMPELPNLVDVPDDPE